MNVSKLQRVVVDALEDVKGQDIKVFNTSDISDLFDRVIIASGTSNRQTRALANSVVESVKEAGGYIISTEGQDTGEWVLVDCGDVVVHIMQPAIRQYYALEEVWGAKPVRIKLGGPGVKVEADDEEDEAPAKPAVKTAAKSTAKPAAKAPAKTVARKTPAKTATKTAAKTATKTAAKKAPRKST